MGSATLCASAFVGPASAQRTFSYVGAFDIISDNGCVDDLNGTGQFGISQPVFVGADGRISDVNVFVHIQHPYRSDLQVGIYYTPLGGSPGTPIVLANAHGVSFDNYLATFDSDAASTCSSDCATESPCNQLPGGNCRPNASLDVFDDVQTPGTFTLTVCDRNPEDDGVIFRTDVVITGTSSSLDVDGNGTIEPLKDGILTLRHQFGFSGEVLTDGAVGDGCLRCTPEQIDEFLDYP